MALNLIYGNSGSGKSTYVFEKTVRAAEKQPQRNFYVIVPEQFTMQTQQELVRRSGHGVIMNIDVVSFERLAYRIFDELGVCNTVMEETGKSLILRRIAEQKAGELTVLKGNIRKMGYIGEIKSMISELMQYDISAEELKEFLGRVRPQSALYYKLSDISVMYGAFEEYLQGGYVTAEKVLEALMDVADDSALLRGAVFVFDGFTGFTPVQMKLLRRLLRIAQDLYVTVTLDVREQPYEKKGIQDLFFMSRKMTRALVRAAGQEKTPIGEPVFLDPARHSRMAGQPVLYHLEQNLFRPRAQAYDEPCGEALKICSLATPQAELRFAAAEICRLMRERGYRYRDFAIVSGDVEQYENYADFVFGSFGIPCFADRKKSVLAHPCIELIRAVLEMVEKDYTYESVFRYLRTGLAGFTGDETDILENYVIAKGIRGHKKWSRQFMVPAGGRGRLRPDETQLLQELKVQNSLRSRLWEQTKPLYEALTGKDVSVRRQTEALYEFLCSISLERQLAAQKERFEAAGEEVLASEYRQIYKIVIDLFDKLVDLLGEEKMSVRDYADILEAGFSTAKVGSIPPGSDCVIMGDIERTRLEGVKVLFFVGVNDGLIPKGARRGGILSQYDRELLEKQEMELAPTVREQAFIQRFYLYLNLTKPAHALYLTYARMDREQKAARPSYLIGTLQKLFPQLSVTEAEEDEPLILATPGSSLRTYLSGLNLAKRGEILPQWKALHLWYEKRQEWAPVIGELFAAAFDGYEEETLPPDLAELIYGSVLTGSVTRLELFAKCAYAHFAEYGLKLSEREQYAFAAMDMGSMFHDILQRYSARVEQASGWLSVTEEEQERMLREAMEESVLTLPNEFLFESARGSHVLERIYRIMRRSVWALTEQIRRGSFRPVGYEVDFVTGLLAPGDGSEAIENEAIIQTANDGKVRLAGRIDRVDTYEKDGEIFVKIVDYKSGNTTFQLLNLYYGQQLQLIVYLNAAMEKMRREHPGQTPVPAGVFYYRLDDPMVEGDGQDEEQVIQNILEQLRPNGLVSLEPEAYLHMDPAVKGRSDVIPLTLKKDGSVSRAGTTGAGREDFGRLTAFVGGRIRKAAERIRKGEIAPKPYAMEQRTGCDYCPYRDMCGFDPKIPGYGYARRSRMKAEEVWERIRREDEAAPAEEKSAKEQPRTERDGEE